MGKRILESGLVNNNNLPQSPCDICGFAEPNSDYLDIDVLDHPDEIKAKKEGRMYGVRTLVRLCFKNGCAKLFLRLAGKILARNADDWEVVE